MFSNWDDLVVVVNEIVVFWRKEIKWFFLIWVWSYWFICKREEDKFFFKEMESYIRLGSESSWYRVWKCRLWNVRFVFY